MCYKNATEEKPYNLICQSHDPFDSSLNISGILKMPSVTLTTVGYRKPEGHAGILGKTVLKCVQSLLDMFFLFKKKKSKEAFYMKGTHS